MNCHYCGAPMFVCVYVCTYVRWRIVLLSVLLLPPHMPFAYLKCTQTEFWYRKKIDFSCIQLSTFEHKAGVRRKSESPFSRMHITPVWAAATAATTTTIVLPFSLSVNKQAGYSYLKFFSSYIKRVFPKHCVYMAAKISWPSIRFHIWCGCAKSLSFENFLRLHYTPLLKVVGVNNNFTAASKVKGEEGRLSYACARAFLFLWNVLAT